MHMSKINYDLVEVGMWRLPGVDFSESKLTDEQLKEFAEWSETEGCVGTQLTPTLWSFKNMTQREAFLQHWTKEQE